jgi:calmodulin
MSQEEIECKQAFNFNAKTHKDKLTFEELIPALECMGILLSAKEKLEMEKKNATYTMDEFNKMVNHHLHEINTEADLLAAFQVFDKDNTGVIDVEEFKHAFMMLGEKFTESECEEVIKIGDKNGEGKLNYKEVVTWMLSGK